MTIKVSKKDSVTLDAKETRKAALVFRAINHELRRKIVDHLEKNERSTVTDIYIRLRLEQSEASQHLGILREAGLVETKREGKFIYYSNRKKGFLAVAKATKILIGE